MSDGEGEAEQLKDVMRVYPQGVTVITTSINGSLYGMTASSFTSVSLQPPLILVAISKSTKLHEVFTSARVFAVNLLAEDQKSVSDRFAGRENVKDRFKGIKFDLVEGCPIIKGVRAYLLCSIWSTYEAGDHTLLLGQVMKGARVSNRRPLAYYQQQYATIAQLESGEPVPELSW
ncbi:MAG: flavin reductase family protein [Conexivisphaerales archaeon]